MAKSRFRSLVLAAWLVNLAIGQEIQWQAPNEVIHVDFSSIKPEPKLAFFPEGFAWEASLSFAMLRESVTIAMKHPESGRAEAMVRSKDAVVELKSESSNDKETRITVRGKLPVMSRADAVAEARKQTEPLLANAREAAFAESEKKPEADLQKYLRERGLRSPTDPGKLREAYAEAHAAEDSKDAILEKLEDLTAKKPDWVTEKERVALRSATGNQRLAAYLRLLQLQIAEQHLQHCGLHLDTTRRNFEALIFTKLDGIYAISSGNIAATEETQRAIRALTRDELLGLKKALTVSISCRFYPQVNPTDPNSQWYNGQRVHCLARGVKMLKAHGELDATNGDAADWWTIVGYDEASLQIKFPKSDEFRHVIIPDGHQRVHLRIMAIAPTPITYTFEVVARDTANGETIEVHETPIPANARFPF